MTQQTAKFRSPRTRKLMIGHDQRIGEHRRRRAPGRQPRQRQQCHLGRGNEAGDRHRPTRSRLRQTLEDGTRWAQGGALQDESETFQEPSTPSGRRRRRRSRAPRSAPARCRPRRRWRSTAANAELHLGRADQIGGLDHPGQPVGPSHRDNGAGVEAPMTKSYRPLLNARDAGTSTIHDQARLRQSEYQLNQQDRSAGQGPSPAPGASANTHR